jgi:hypothetical protein
MLMNADVGAVIGAVTGAVVTALGMYAVGEKQRRDERQDRVHLAATALLIEMRSIDWMVRSMYEDRDAAFSRGRLPVRALESTRRDVLLMPPRVQHAIFLVYGLCEDVEMLRDRYRAEARSDVVWENHLRVRGKAAHAAEAIARCVPLLIELGGVAPDGEPATFLREESLPALPPEPFGQPPLGTHGGRRSR